MIFLPYPIVALETLKATIQINCAKLFRPHFRGISRSHITCSYLHGNFMAYVKFGYIDHQEEYIFQYCCLDTNTKLIISYIYGFFSFLNCSRKNNRVIMTCSNKLNYSIHNKMIKKLIHTPNTLTVSIYVLKINNFYLEF